MQLKIYKILNSLLGLMLVLIAGLCALYYFWLRVAFPDLRGVFFGAIVVVCILLFGFFKWMENTWDKRVITRMAKEGHIALANLRGGEHVMNLRDSSFVTYRLFSFDAEIITPEGQKFEKTIYEKMNRLGLPISVDAIEKNLNDIAGVRVICSFVDDIYKLADMLAVQDDVYVVRTKDYIKNPKESGYRSLHMIVEVPIFLSNEKRYMRVEVQLRTIAMDFWASLEHKLRYKKDIPAETADAIARQLQDCAEVVARTDKQMYDIRKQIEASGIQAGVE